MEEVACPRCGGIFVPENTAEVCPNCSHNAGALFPRLRREDIDLIGIALFLIFSAAVVHSLLFALVALAEAWAMFSVNKKIGLHRPPTALNLGTQITGAVVPISQPSMPDNWKDLASVPRPRRVIMSAPIKADLALSVAVFLGVGAFFADLFWKQFAVPRKHPFVFWLGGLWLALWVYFGTRCVRHWFSCWEILRDGELTTGVLTDWREGRSGPSISYRYWTNSGKSFECSGRVVSKKELADQEAPLKVFYLPQDPSKSVALCCTKLRITIDRT
jgi:hypothetical protein